MRTNKEVGQWRLSHAASATIVCERLTCKEGGFIGKAKPSKLIRRQSLLDVFGRYITDRHLSVNYRIDGDALISLGS